MPDGIAAAQGCLVPGVTMLFVCGALYASFIIGITGGPNHGEHPFLLSMIHLGFFLWLGRRWAWGPWTAYLGVMVLVFAVALWSMHVGYQPRGARTWTARFTMLGLHAALYAIAATTGSSLTSP